MKSLLLFTVMAAATWTLISGSTGRLGKRPPIDRKGYARSVSVRYAASGARW